MIEVDLPDGTIAEFPDGTSNDVIKGALQKKFGKAEQNPGDGLPYGQAPEGMVLDPETGQMVDTKAIADQGDGSWAGAFIKGMPFIGEYADELVGGGDEVNTELARQMADKFERDNPTTALAGQVATGLTTLPAAVMTGQALPGALTATLPRAVATGLVGGSVAGGIEGAVSGYGEGRDGESRGARAGERGAAGAIVGGGLGAATPLAGAGLKKVANKVLDSFSVDRQAAKLGISRPTAKAVTDAMSADDALGVTGGQRMLAAGEDAMLADSGASAQSLLDTAIQRSGKGGRTANDAVMARANRAGQRLKTTMDEVLGIPEGTNKAARDISQRTAASRKAAYDAAYAQPIDYAAGTGRKIEDIVSRVPPNILKEALQEANEAMIESGRRNMQIMADIADDGSVTFRNPPNVEQLDKLKQALGTVAAEKIDTFGRPTAAGMRAGRLAKQLRDTLVDAVPEYGQAVKLGGDKIAEDRALELGTKLLSPGMSREAVAEATKNLSEAERKQIALGLRQQIDDTMASVNAALTDSNMDAREATKALKMMSSRTARWKVARAIGQDNAAKVFKELDRTQAAIELKASVATNSKTFARTTINDAVKDMHGSGPVNALKDMEPVKAAKLAGRTLTGRSPEAMKNAEDQVFSQISELLTGPRGSEAMEKLRSLMGIYDQIPANERLARSAGNAGAAALTLPAFQTGTRQIPSE